MVCEDVIRQLTPDVDAMAATLVRDIDDDTLMNLRSRARQVRREALLRAQESTG